MKTFKKLLALILSVVMLISIFTVAPFTANAAKPKFVKITTNKTTKGKIAKKNETDYYKLKIKKKSKVALLAYNGNLEKFQTLKCKIYKDKALTKRVYKTTLRVTDTDMWSTQKKLKAGTYYITLKSKNKFEYYLSCDVLPVK